MSSEPRVEGGIHGSRNAYGIFAIVPVRDTTPDAAEIQTTIHRRLGPAARLRLAMEMSDAVRELAKAGIRSRHPEYTELEVAQALGRILYPEININIATAEDVVIAKLEWAKLSRSERQPDDVAGIIRSS